MGARSAGLGYSSACLQDEWSVFNNVAGIAHVKSPALAASYHAQPSLPSANQMAFVALTPLSFGTMGVGALKFGDQLYSEQIVTAGISNTFGITSLGAKVNYIQYNATGFGTRGLVTISMGGITQLIPSLYLGAHIININQPVISHETGERLPTVLIAGLGYSPSQKLFLSTELEKDLDHTPTWKIGMEYSPVLKFSFRTGFNLNPNAAFFGLGFRSGRLTFDYAMQYNMTLAASHQLSTAYQLKKKHAKNLD